MALPIPNRSIFGFPTSNTNIQLLSDSKPDHNNYSLFGKSWKDRSNGVTLLSSKVGQGEALTKPEQEIHQKNLLNARLGAFLETLKTPCVIRKETIGPFDAPFMKIPIPTLLNARVFSKTSFNENVAINKVKSAFVKSDADIRKLFLVDLNNLLNKGLSSDSEIKITKLHDELMKISAKPNCIADLATLNNEKELLSKKRSANNDSGKLGLFFSNADRKLLQIERKIASIEKPSAYKLHLAKSFHDRGIDRPIQVTDHPLYVEELKKKRDVRVPVMRLPDTTDNAQANPGASDIESTQGRLPAQRFVSVKSSSEIQLFTEEKFKMFSSAIRDFQDSDGGDLAQKNLQELARPILYSKERVAVHRFIHDMVRQLKRAGVSKADLTENIRELENLKSTIRNDDADRTPCVSLRPTDQPHLQKEPKANDVLSTDHRMGLSIQEMKHQMMQLEELDTLIPEESCGAMTLLQSITHGTGKQMRLQDEAERMLQALPKVLELVKTHHAKLETNLMSFNLDGVEALRLDLNSNSTTASPATIHFLKSSQGKTFSEVLVKFCKTMPDNQNIYFKKLSSNRDKPEKFFSCLKELSQQNNNSLISDELIKKHQHIFMETSDREFWEREAIGKIATRLDTSQTPADVQKTSRIFKQMHMRAGAMQMEEQKVKNFMMQGIANTLRNRNMAVEGSRMGGIIGAAAANLASTPLTVPLANISPVLAAPGITDAILMPIGWGMGIVPGALGIGKVLANKKKERLAEVNNLAHALDVFPPNRQTGAHLPNIGPSQPQVQKGEALKYTSSIKALELSGKNAFHIVPIKKPVSNALHIAAGSQFAKAHGKVWADIGKETVSVIGKTMRYAFYQGPREAWIDLVLHREIKRKKGGIDSAV